MFDSRGKMGEIGKTQEKKVEELFLLVFLELF